MAQAQHTPTLASLEEAITVLSCLVDDTYAFLDPSWRNPESLKRLSDSGVLTLALFRQLRGIESERSFLRDVQRSFVHLFPRECWGCTPPRSIDASAGSEKLPGAFAACGGGGSRRRSGDDARSGLDAVVEAPHPRRVAQSAGFEGASSWVRRGSFSIYGLKPHLICSANRVPVSYELAPANIPEVLLVEGLLDEARLGEGTARRLFGDLAYRGGALGKALAERSVLLATERADRRPAVGRQVEVRFATLKRVFGMDGTLAKTLVGLATRIVAKIAAYTYGCCVNRFLGRAQGRIKEPWA
jgi:hypothetical protein